MNAREAAELAELVAEQWAPQPTAAHGAASAATEGAPTSAGAYWPLSSSAPVRTHPADRVRFIGASALGTILLFCFTLDAKPRQYLLCFDVSTWPTTDPLLTTGAVYKSVVRLLGTPDWKHSQAKMLEVGPGLAVIPG